MALCCPSCVLAEDAEDEDYSYVSSGSSSDPVSGTVLVKKGQAPAKAVSSPAAETKAGMGVSINSTSKERTRQWMLEQKSGKAGTAGDTQPGAGKANISQSKLKPSTEKSSIPHPEGNTTDAPAGFDAEFRQTKRTPSGRKVIGLDTRGEKWEKTQKKTPVKLEKPAPAVKAETPSPEDGDIAVEPLVDATDEIMQTTPTAKPQAGQVGKLKASAEEGSAEDQQEEAAAPVVKAGKVKATASKQVSKTRKGKTSGPELLPLPEDPDGGASASGKLSMRKRKVSSAESAESEPSAKDSSASAGNASEPVSLFDQKFDGDMPLAAQRKARKSSGK